MITILKILGILWAVLVVIGIILSIVNAISKHRTDEYINNWTVQMMESDNDRKDDKDVTL